MLSASSCDSCIQKQCRDSNGLIHPSKLKCRQPKKDDQLFHLSKGGQAGRLVGYLMIACLLSISINQCNSHPFKAGSGGDQSIPPGVPCLCDGRFFQSCPGLSVCSEVHSTRNKAASRFGSEAAPRSYDDHGADHPDHVDENVSSLDEVSIPRSLSPSELDSSSDEDLNQGEGKATIVRHRKIYVSAKEAEEDPVVIPIKITIPVEYKDEKTAIPPPKPLFKMRKYTTYETKPEIEMVPVSTTIIKPVGATKDQFIDDKTL